MSEQPVVAWFLLGLVLGVVLGVSGFVSGLRWAARDARRTAVTRSTLAEINRRTLEEL